jgi:hypothetical protein
MVGLKVVEVEETPEKVRRREAKAALKMSGKDNYFTWLGRGLALLARDPAEYFLRYPPSPV